MKKELTFDWDKPKINNMGQYRIIAKVYDENDNEILSDDCFIDPTEAVIVEFEWDPVTQTWKHVGSRPKTRPE